MNDWSARDLQRRETKVTLRPAKGKDFATTLGPWLVTADELEPYHDPDGFLALDMRASVNGTEVGQDLLSNMGWPFEDLLS
jgi:2-keto-4-pentenoate hydratase/2-oxohepta-3-ene-1,7-dioic acid hydratase in catechol pathway